MKLKTKIISVLAIIILICSGLVYYKLHNIVKSDLEKVVILESKNKQLKEYITKAEEELEIDKEMLSMTKKEIEKYGSGAVTKSDKADALLGMDFHPTDEEYGKRYSNYAFKKKVLDAKKEEFSDNKKEIGEIKKEISKLSLFK